MLTRSRRSLIASGLILLASACGGPGPENAPQATAASSEAPFDLQTLLTRAEAAAALGEPVAEPELTATRNPLGQELCLFAPVDAGSERFIQLSVVRDGGMSEALRVRGFDAARVFTDTRANLTGVEPVPGLGDEAFWGTNGLHVLDDDVYLTISVGNTNSPENLELARGIAGIVVGRLRSAATDN